MSVFVFLNVSSFSIAFLSNLLRTPACYSGVLVCPQSIWCCVLVVLRRLFLLVLRKVFLAFPFELGIHSILPEVNVFRVHEWNCSCCLPVMVVVWICPSPWSRSPTWRKSGRDENTEWFEVKRLVTLSTTYTNYNRLPHLQFNGYALNAFEPHSPLNTYLRRFFFETLQFCLDWTDWCCSLFFSAAAAVGTGC